MPTESQGFVQDVPLNENGSTSDSLQAALLYSILNGSPLAETLLLGYTNNYASAVDRIFKYGVSDYLIRLPTEVPGTVSAERYYPIVPIIVINYGALSKNRIPPEPAPDALEIDHLIYTQQTLFWERTEALYNASNKLLKILGLDLDEIDEGLRKNSSYSDIVAADINISARVGDTSAEACKYFFHFFTKKAQQQNRSLEEFLQNIDDPGLVPSEFFSLLKFNITERDNYVFKDMTFGYQYAHETLRTGSIGEIDSCSYKKEANYYVEEHRDFAAHVYRKQINETQYREIAIIGFRVFHYMSRIDNTKQIGSPEDALVLPVSRDTAVENLTNKELNTFLQRSVYLHIEAIVEEDLSPFEGLLISPEFNFILEAVGFAFFVLSFGTSTTIELTLKELIKIIIKQIVINLVISYTLTAIVKKLGVSAAVIIAIGAAIAARKLDYKFAPSLFGLPWAGELLFAVTAITESINEVTEEEFKELTEEQEQLESEAEKIDKQIKAAYDSLGSSSNLPSGFDLLHTSTRLSVTNLYLHETPTEFYDRTIHDTNPGILSIEAVEIFVEGALTLPESLVLTDYDLTKQQQQQELLYS